VTLRGFGSAPGSGKHFSGARPLVPVSAVPLGLAFGVVHTPETREIYVSGVEDRTPLK
jgi:hypothetical protein